MKLAILGIQGSGKGTQANFLAQDFGWEHISGGDLLREEERKETVEGKEIKTYIDRGALVPDEIINSLLLPKIQQEHFILDGYPRNINEAHSLDKQTTLDHVIYITLNEHAVYQRLMNRIQCPKCHEPYGPGKPEQNKGYCDKCHKQLIKRIDDSQQAIKERMNIFKEVTKPVIQHYRKKKLLITVNGNQPPKTIYQELLKKLQLEPKKKLFKADMT